MLGWQHSDLYSVPIDTSPPLFKTNHIKVKINYSNSWSWSQSHEVIGSKLTCWTVFTGWFVTKCTEQQQWLLPVYSFCTFGAMLLWWQAEQHRIMVPLPTPCSTDTLPQPLCQQQGLKHSQQRFVSLSGKTPSSTFLCTVSGNRPQCTMFTEAYIPYPIPQSRTLKGKKPKPKRNTRK